MSRGIICDNCGSAMPTNSRGEHVDGEEAGWLSISPVASDETWHACTRSCAVELIDAGPVGPYLDHRLAEFTAIAKAVQG